ncbi:MAG: sporulation protein YunB [Oscillospiraceae bacterium]|nr:sporulation protein YunB [Oscillospiraceae bacterium]
MRKRSANINGKRLRIFLIILIFILILFFLIRGIEKNIAPTAVKQGEYYSGLMANRIINKAVSDYLKENEYNYSNFSTVLYDENGTPVSIETISYNINKVQSELAVKIADEFSESRNLKTKIPIGSLTDSYLLAGKGISVPLNICSVGNVEVVLKSEFTSAGINQTCHRISVLISADINSAIPLYSFSSEADFEFLIAENIIVGGVPDCKVRNF